MLTKLRVGQLRLGILLTLLAALLGGATATPASAQLLSVANDHACVVRSSGHVACWGKNDRGQLGDGTTTSRAHPVIVKDVDHAIAVSVSIGRYASSTNSWSCALRSDGRVQCWGNISPPDDLKRPVGLASYVDALKDATTISIGDSYGCAARANGRLACWGSKPLIADRAYDTPLDITSADMQWGTQGTVCGLRRTGAGYCYDFSSNGSGYYAVRPPWWPRPVTSINNSCAVDTARRALCFGSWPGNGSTYSAKPVDVSGIDDALQVATQQNSSCLLRATGAVLCWGADELDQVGNGYGPLTSADQRYTAVLTPTPLPGVEDATEISVGGKQACALRRTGAIDCWGEDPLAGNPSRSLSPGAPVTGLREVASIGVGDSAACATRTSGTVACWGARVQEYYSAPLREPADIAGIASATQVAAGSFKFSSSNCVLLTGGTVSCFGPGVLVSVPDRNDSSRPFQPGWIPPTPITGITGATQLSVGGYHGCVRRSDERAVCWGWNTYLQSSPTTGISWVAPRVVDGVTSVAAVSAGDKFSCALLTTGDVRCWGSPLRGRIGVNDPGNYGPRRVPGITGAVAIDVNGATGCALIRGGTVRCWGAGTAGQLGNGQFNDSVGTAVQVDGLTDATSITVGEQNVCAIRATHAVVCWGKGFYGMLGDGKTVRDTATPVTVTGLTDATTIDAGQNSVCAIKTDQTVVCWGTRTDYQLGDTPAGLRRLVANR